MHEIVTVDMCVSIRSECPTDYLVIADNQAEFSFGGQHSGFHHAFDVDALRAFLKIGAEALAELEGQVNQLNDGRATLVAVTAGEQPAHEGAYQ
jgi:hypothetical protein